MRLREWSFRVHLALRKEVETAPKLPDGTIVRIVREMREGRTFAR